MSIDNPRTPTALLELRHRPFVVDLRDWLACLALIVASTLMLAAMVVGHSGVDTTTPRPAPAIQLVPDPGVRPSPMPGPPIYLPR